MKTKFFRESGFTETGIKRLKRLAELKPQTKAIFINWFKQLKEKPIFDRNLTRQLAAETGESAELVDDITLITSSMLQYLGGYGDSIEDFIEDLRSSKSLDEEKHFESIRKYLEDLSCVTQLYHLLSRARATELDGAASLKSSSMSAAIKPVYERDFRYGEDELTKFNLNPISYVCVAMVELEKDDANEHFTFQMNRETFDKFLSDLIVLQARMKQMEEPMKILKRPCGGEK